MDRPFFILAALLGGLAVGLGAFGAHALEARLSVAQLGTFETGVRYHFYHALALVAVAVAITRFPQSSLATTAGWLFVAGIVIFSGSLYALTVTRLLGEGQLAGGDHAAWRRRVYCGLDLSGAGGVARVAVAGTATACPATTVVNPLVFPLPITHVRGKHLAPT